LNFIGTSAYFGHVIIKTIKTTKIIKLRDTQEGPSWKSLCGCPMETSTCLKQGKLSASL
jgi:hypothetical protein